MERLTGQGDAQLRAFAAVEPDTPLDRALRSILIFYLEQIQQLAAAMLKAGTVDEVAQLQRVIRGGRHLFRSMPEQFDVTDVVSIPRQLRWLSKNCRSPRRWHAMSLQVERYLSSDEGRSTGVEDFWQAMQDEVGKVRDELMLALSSRRYHRFIAAVQEFVRTKDAGIFGRTTARSKLGQVLPSLIWDQYRELLSFNKDLSAPKRKILRELRRRVRSFSHLLAHFQAVLESSRADCLFSLLDVDEFLTYYLDVGQVIDFADSFLKAEGQQRTFKGVKAFAATKRAEQEQLRARLPSIWESVGSQRFRTDLEQALAEL